MNPKTECLKCINYSGHVILDENFFFLSEVGRALEVQRSDPVADFKKWSECSVPCPVLAPWYGSKNGMFENACTI